MLDRKARTANERQVHGMRQLPRPKRSEQLESSRARVPLFSNLSSSSPAWLELTPARSNTKQVSPKRIHVLYIRIGFRMLLVIFKTHLLGS